MVGQDIILEIDGIERIFSFKRLPITIGRRKGNDIALAENIISGEHGKIFCRDLDIIYEDLGSTNGTYVDGKFIRGEKTILGSDGRIVFGKPSGPEIRYRLIDKTITRRDHDLLFEKACGHLRMADYSKALAYFEQVIEEGGSTPAAYCFAGFAASQVAEIDTAIIHFEQYLALMPRDVRTMVDLGKLYERKGLYGKAASRYRKALELKPDDDAILKRLKDLDRFEPVSDSFIQPRSTEEILGADLVDDISTRHFMVTYYVARHGRRLNDILKILEEAYSTTGEHLGVYPNKKVPVVLSCDEGTFHVGRSNAVGTASVDGIRALITPRTLTEEPFLKVLLVHEYVHYLLDTSNPDGNTIPWWLHEGLAQYESQNMCISSETLISQMMHVGALIPLEILERGVSDQEVPGLVNLAYAQAYSLVEYCVVRYGWNTLRSLLDGFASDRRADAYRDAGMEYESLESSWQEWLQKRLGKAETGKTVKLKD